MLSAMSLSRASEWPATYARTCPWFVSKLHRRGTFAELDFMCRITIVVSPVANTWVEGLVGSGGEMSSLNLAARAGRWSAAHWKTAVAVWVGFVVLAIG